MELVLRALAEGCGLNPDANVLNGNHPLRGILLATGANPLTIDPINSGLDVAIGCEDINCLPPIHDGLTSSAPLTGDVSLTGSTLDLNIQLTSANTPCIAGGGRSPQSTSPTLSTRALFR